MLDCVKSCAVKTICWADFTKRPDRPMMSGFSSFTASISCCGVTLIPNSITLKPLLLKMMSTKFLPISCTSPLTVARITFPFPESFSVASIWGSKKATDAFITSALWSTSATISWLSLNKRPTSAIPFISGPLIISNGSSYWAKACSKSGSNPSFVPSTIYIANRSSSVNVEISTFASFFLSR